MRLARFVAPGIVLVVGGALPWLAGFAGFSAFQNHPTLLLVWQSLLMPGAALAAWFLLSDLSPAHARLYAALLSSSIWLVPGLWLAFSGAGRAGWALGELPSLLWKGPIILSLAMQISLGLALALVAPGIAAFWKRRGHPGGAVPRARAFSPPTRDPFDGRSA